MDNFEEALRRIINAHSVDNRLGIPDFILAKFVCKYIDSLETLTNECDAYFDEIEK